MLLLYLVKCCITLNHILVQGYISPISQGRFVRIHEYWQLRSTSKNSRVESASEDLLSLLLDTNKSKHDDEFQIESLINFLKETNSQFNPDVSLNGPLYAVVYQSGPRPFWEKFDLGLSLGTKKRKNIKGQKYTKVSDGVYNVQNYAEFIGQQFAVEAKGVCTRSNAAKEPKRNATQFTRLLEQTFKKNSSSLVQCPADYDITAKGVSINILGKKFDVDVKGKGYMRVLYADDNLRILTSRKDTSSTRNSIDEKAGLTVVQVRVDLIDPTFRLQDYDQ
mmetsp:Transcript_13156/g.24727  ORF Transcript_13156/g.24727 Transcript_13156/m.24727 type:complete len:278 (-) Transcript_13156:47-880(-)